jgi:AhpD family alkylhydroperoxidase
MPTRMTNPALVLPTAMKGIGSLLEALDEGGLDPQTRELVGLRTSQINGCSACVHAHVRDARKFGATEDRLATVAAWREAPFFTDAERAALALAEAATRLADRPGEAVLSGRERARVPGHSSPLRGVRAPAAGAGCRTARGRGGVTPSETWRRSRRRRYSTLSGMLGGCGGG